MLFSEQDAPVLKAWIVKRLEAPSRSDSDVDADVLADYVLALLRHDGDPKDVRKLCETELYDFLKEETGPFVSDVFNAVSHKYYLPGAGAPPPPKQDQPLQSVPSNIPSTYPQTQIGSAVTGAGFGPGYGALQAASGAPPPPPLFNANAQHQPQQNGSRKRSYQDSSLPPVAPPGHIPMPNGWNPYMQSGRGGRAFKQPRRGGAFRGGRRGGRDSPAELGLPASAAAIPGPPGPAGGSPGSGGAAYPTEMSPRRGSSASNEQPFNMYGNGANGTPPLPVEAILQMQRQMGLPLPVYSGFVSPAAAPSPRGGRRRCRNFDRKGFCTRRNCPFEHGIPANNASPTTPTPASLPFLPQGPNGFPIPPPFLSPFVQQQQQQQQQQQLQQSPQQRPRKGGKAQFSADGPVFDKTRSTIVVEGIPDEHLSEAAVRDFFGQFGPIVSVALQPRRKLAIVKFETWAAANAAYQSPKVIFDNRFVKVFWHKEDAKTNGAPKKKQGVGGEGAAEAGSLEEEGEAAEAGEGDDGDGAPAFDMEEFLRKQEAAQKLHEEKMQKKAEIERRRQELEARQKALFARQQEERQRLVAKMAAVATKARKQQQQQQSGEEANGTDDDRERSGSAEELDKAAAAAAKTEMIRAQLAALEEEAKQLGLDPDAIVGGHGGAAADGGSSHASAASWTPRGGGGYGRGGRGGFPAYRGRGGGGGGYAPRGGGSAGGSSSSSVYAAYSLDNRPRRVAVTGVDFTAPAQDEALRQYLLGVGEFVAIDTAPAETTITFADRRAAEKFFYGLPSAGAQEATSPSAKHIPGIEAPVELRWVAGAAPATAATVAAGASGSGPGSGPGSATVTNSGKGSGLNGSAYQQNRDESGAFAVGNAESEEEGELPAEPEPRPAQQMDFDVADEGDWDMH